MPKTNKEIRRPLVDWDGTTGFITDFFIIGFFHAGVHHVGDPDLFEPKISDYWETDWLKPWGGETGIRDIPKTQNQIQLEWLPVRGDGLIPRLILPELRNRYKALDAEWAGVNWPSTQWYALAVLDSDRAQTVDLVFCVWDGTRMFFNGKLIFEEHSWHHPIIDKERVRLKLKKGRNTLLFKNEREGLIARLERPDGKPVSGVSVITNAEPPPIPKISALAHVQRLGIEQKIEMPFEGKNPADLKEWQKKFRSIYVGTLGRTPPKIAVNNRTVKIIEEIKCEGFTRRLAHIPAEKDSVFPAYVFIPHDDRRNGKTIVTIHGHGNWEWPAGTAPLPKPRGNAAGIYTGNYTEQLANHGFVTAVPCLRAFGPRNDMEGMPHACTEFDLAARLGGYSLIRLNIEDVHRLADYVSTLDGVDGNKLGLTGLSGGATTTWLTGAFDGRFAAVAPFCGLLRIPDYIMFGGCGLQHPFGVFPYGDTPELLSLIAPRPLLIAQGKLDSGFNIVRAKSIYRDTLKAYKASGHPENLELYLFNLAHQFDCEYAAKWFGKHL